MTPSRKLSRVGACLAWGFGSLALVVSAARAQIIYANDFESAAGAEFSNPTVSTTPVGGRRFLGEFGHQTVTLSLPAALFPSGTQQVVLSFDLFVIRSYDGNTTNDRISVAANGTLGLNATFANNPGVGPFTEQSYSLATPLGGGPFPFKTGAAESNTLGYSFDGPRDAVYSFAGATALTFDYSAGSNFVVTFASTQDGPNSPADESWGIDNVKLTAVVPEPPTAISLMMGITGVGVLRWRTRQKSARSQPRHEH